MVALDTNVAIALLRGNTQLLADAKVQPEDCALPVIVTGELLFGARNSGRPAENLAAYRRFVHDLHSLLFDGLAAEHYAQIRLVLKLKGRPIPENDMWIAAICRAHDVPRLTFDRHFAKVPGLALVAL